MATGAGRGVSWLQDQTEPRVLDPAATDGGMVPVHSHVSSSVAASPPSVCTAAMAMMMQLLILIAVTMETSIQRPPPPLFTHRHGAGLRWVRMQTWTGSSPSSVMCIIETRF